MVHEFKTYGINLDMVEQIIIKKPVRSERWVYVNKKQKKRKRFLGIIPYGPIEEKTIKYFKYHNDIMAGSYGMLSAEEIVKMDDSYFINKDEPVEKCIYLKASVRIKLSSGDKYGWKFVTLDDAHAFVSYVLSEKNIPIKWLD